MTISRRVSVVMPTYNRLATLRRALTSFSQQTVDTSEYEVVVISDGATDGTDDFLRDSEMPFDLVFATQDNAGPAAARNHGVRVATGDLLLFIDDDVIAAPDLVEQHVVTHDGNDDRAVVVGPMLTPPDYRPNAFVRWEQAMLYKQYEAMDRGDWAPTYRQFYTGNASLSRSFLVSVGGFDERFRRAEDVELAYRLSDNGARFIFNRSAIGHHYAERSFDSWLRNARDYGRNDVVFDREQGRTDRLESTPREFAGRNVLVRGLTHVCVGRHRLESSLRWPMRGIAAVGDRLALDGLTQSALSGLYNTYYYCGMADELGGPAEFWSFIERGHANTA